MLEDQISFIIAEIMSSVLGISINPDQNILRDSEARWDSLKHIEIIFAVEEAFDIRFDEQDITGIISTDDLKAKVASKNAA